MEPPKLSEAGTAKANIEYDELFMPFVRFTDGEDFTHELTPEQVSVVLEFEAASDRYGRLMETLNSAKPIR